MKDAIAEVERIETTRGLTMEVKGTHLPLQGRKPTEYEEGRTCSTKDCGTVLTKYNKATTCFHHSPKKYPRIRGRITR